jgi:poly(3-hydroxybutyrate) depolymerase
MKSKISEYNKLIVPSIWGTSVRCLSFSSLTIDMPFSQFSGTVEARRCRRRSPPTANLISRRILTQLQVYISKPADYPHSPSKLLLLLTGGTGVKSTNNQLQADKFATEGFLVIMPDQYAPHSQSSGFRPANKASTLDSTANRLPTPHQNPQLPLTSPSSKRSSSA